MKSGRVETGKGGHDKERVIIFTTDRGYIIPTLVVVRQLLTQPAVMDIADIIVFTIGLTQEEREELGALFPSEAVHFVEMESSNFDLPAGVNFQETHVPKTALARLFTPRLIPEFYKHILYLDGDIQILGDIGPLVEAVVPEGKILAANDQFFLRRFRLGSAGQYWRRHVEYMNSIGIYAANEYFNSGILAAELSTWKSICEKALIYFFNNSELCLYHDQSALNATSIGRREVLSPLYNYTTPYVRLALEGVNPKIVHFTGAIKPWAAGGEAMWSVSYRQPYQDIVDEFPAIAKYSSFRPSDDGTVRTSLLGRLYERWREFIMRRRFDNYVRNHQFLFQ